MQNNYDMMDSMLSSGNDRIDEYNLQRNALSEAAETAVEICLEKERALADAYAARENSAKVLREAELAIDAAKILRDAAHAKYCSDVNSVYEAKRNLAKNDIIQN